MDLDNNNFIIIDDIDPRIQYNGNLVWIIAGIKGKEWNGTLHGYRGDATAHALLTFIGVPIYPMSSPGPFIKFLMLGTSVAVYGTIPGAKVQGSSTYSIDGATSGPLISTFTTPSISVTMYQQLFYQSPELENKQHNLTIIPNTVSPNTFWLDYFLVTQPIQTTEPTVTTSTTNATVSADINPKLQTPNMRHVPLGGIIAGSVVGGILVLLAIVFVIWRGYKRRVTLRRTCQPCSVRLMLIIFIAISPPLPPPTETARCVLKHLTINFALLILSRIHHTTIHDAHLFRKSPETRQFGMTPMASNSDHREPRFGTLVEAPPTYSTYMSSPV